MMNTECNHSKGDMNMEAKSSSSGSYGKVIEVVIILILIGSYYCFIHDYYYSTTVNTAELILMVDSRTFGHEMANILVSGEEYDKVFNHLDMLNAPFEGKVFTCAKQVKPYPGESTTTTTTTISSKGLSHDKGKGILVEPEKPLKKKDQLKLAEDIALKLQAEIDKEERITKAEEEKIDEANIAWDDIQAKVDVDYQLAERLQAEEQ
ncbi:hypothetical protein Tco_1044688 [Tanacetum coccineum]|uniref:Uncharacterized protein n=1 Tax=Tanacetum coccineum TaxID=301880 RepID=A0ABQ5GT63_9ASTR